MDPSRHAENDIEQLFSECSLDSEHHRPGPLAFLPRLKRSSSSRSQSPPSNPPKSSANLRQLIRWQARKLLQIRSKDEVPPVQKAISNCIYCWRIFDPIDSSLFCSDQCAKEHQLIEPYFPPGDLSRNNSSIDLSPRSALRNITSRALSPLARALPLHLKTSYLLALNLRNRPLVDKLDHDDEPMTLDRPLVGELDGYVPIPWELPWELPCTNDHGWLDLAESPPILIDPPASNPTTSPLDPPDLSPNSVTEESSRDGTLEESDISEEELTESDSSSSSSSSSSSIVSPLVNHYQRQAVDRLMAEFKTLLDQSLGIRRRVSSEASSSASTSQHISTSQQPTGPSRHDKRKREDADDNEDINHGGDGEGPKRAMLDVPSSGPVLRFACPYYRRNPRRHTKHRSCAGPGWVSVHRVKEHVYRQHELPIYCARCCTVFKAEAQLTAHQRLPQGCQVQTVELPEGFTKEQEKRLRKRKKTPRDEGYKWRDMYMILFPDEDEDMIPTPYYDGEHHIENWENKLEEEFNQYERYLRRELPQAVRRRLEEAVAEFSEPYESQLRGQLVDIVRDTQSQLFRAYRHEAQQDHDDEKNTTDNTDAFEVQDIFDLSAFLAPSPVPESYSIALGVDMLADTPSVGMTHPQASDSGFGSTASTGIGLRTDDPVCEVDFKLAIDGGEDGYMAPGVTHQSDNSSTTWPWGYR